MIVIKEKASGSIPELIRTTRKEKGLTLEALSKLSGYSVPTLSRWENGSRSMTVDKFVELMRLMGADVMVR